MGRKIAIVGTAPSGVDAPYNDPSFEMWGVSSRMDYFVRATRWFELHRLDGEVNDWATAWRREFSLWPERFKEVPLPEIMMFFPEPLAGAKVTFLDPKPLTERFGTDFLTSTIAWMFALAISEGDVEEIGLWGADMEYGTEYREQRTGVRHFMLLARALGIRMTSVKTSGLTFEPVPYPFWMDDPLIAKVEHRTKAGAKRLREQDELIRDGERRQNERRGLLKYLKELSESDDVTKQIAALTSEIASVEDGLWEMRVDRARFAGSGEELAYFKNYLHP